MKQYAMPILYAVILTFLMWVSNIWAVYALMVVLSIPVFALLHVFFRMGGFSIEIAFTENLPLTITIQVMSLFAIYTVLSAGYPFVAGILSFPAMLGILATTRTLIMEE